MTVKIGVIGAHGRLGKTIAALTPILPITRATDRKNLDCDVLIDVSTPAALLENLSVKKPIVIGTTGHSSLRPLEEASKYLPVLYAPNFSLGIAILRKIASQIAKAFPSDVDLIEIHHAEKKDAPSGTALLLTKDIPQAKIHSLRSGKIVGEHTLIFNTAEERITLSHTAHSREVFARGALAAARFLVNKPPGLYTMDNLFS